MSDQIVQRVELCANKTDGVTCGHTADSHFLESRSQWERGPNDPPTRRITCLARGCPCLLYVPPTD